MPDREALKRWFFDKWILRGRRNLSFKEKILKMVGDMVGVKEVRSNLSMEKG
jgi:hypothetical protein